MDSKGSPIPSRRISRNFYAPLLPRTSLAPNRQAPRTPSGDGQSLFASREKGPFCSMVSSKAAGFGDVLKPILVTFFRLLCLRFRGVYAFPQVFGCHTFNFPASLD